MNKNKTNLSVINNIGMRVQPNILVGDSGDYTSGDILDANAVSELVDNKVANAGHADSTVEDTINYLNSLINAMKKKLDGVRTPVPPNGDIQIFGDRDCTRPAFTDDKIIYARFNCDLSDYEGDDSVEGEEYWTFSGGGGNDYISVQKMGDTYSMDCFIDWASHGSYSEPFMYGQVVPLENNTGLLDPYREDFAGIYNISN